MGYVGPGIAEFSATSLKSALLYSIDGGVNYSADGLMISDNQVSSCKNMWLQNGIIMSRPELSELETGRMNGETIHSGYYFEENMIVHCGTKLYSIGEESGVTELLDGLPDKHSIALEFSGLLYFYCDTHVFSVDRKLSAEETIPYAPVYATNVDTRTGILNELTDGFEANILAPYISIVYGKALEVKYIFPSDIDLTRKFVLYNGEDIIAPENYVYDDTGFWLDRNLTLTGSVKLSYYSNLNILESDDNPAGCTVGTTFGGGTLEGTRVILAGNSDSPGKYYSSELANGLYFKKNSGGTIGAGTDNITAFSKQHGYLLIFTENTVSRMNYNYTSETGGYFSIHTINNTVGCDSPGSVAVIDNRTVFANSNGGVYIVDALENYDMLNIVPISRNITDMGKSKGILSVSGEELKNAVGCLYERKYMLLAGEKIFVWDYGQVPYSSTSDCSKMEKKLVWFEFDGMIDAISVSAVKSELFVIKRTGEGESTVYRFDSSSERLETTEYGLCSKNMDMNLPHTRKVVRTFKFECRTNRETDVKIMFYADGKLYHSIEKHVVPDADGYAAISLRLPKYVLEHFSFCIKCNSPGTGIFNIELNYMVLKSNLKR